MKSKKIIIFFLAALVFPYFQAYSQIKGEPPEKGPDQDLSDTNFIFESPRPLIDLKPPHQTLQNAWGLDLIFSNNGFGAGGFWQNYFNRDWLGMIDLYISGAKSGDEFEEFDPFEYEFRVPNKINRIYMFPLTFGARRYLFREVLFETLRPYASLGAGPTLIMTTPYERDFFEAFGYAKFYTRFAGFIGIGADVGSFGKSLMSLNIRYYYIPFGGDGIESIRDEPIHNLGGVFLCLSLGRRY